MPKSIATQVFNKYGSCKMEVSDFRARYFYLDENHVWVEVDYDLL